MWKFIARGGQNYGADGSTPGFYPSDMPALKRIFGIGSRAVQAYGCVRCRNLQFMVFTFRDQEAAIAAAAKELDALRQAWLNPPEWTREEISEFPGSVDGSWARYIREPNERGIGTVHYPRLVAKDNKTAALLAKRTPTNLYNELPTWLDLAHRKLDEAVFAAYGWESTLPDEEILARLLELNQIRSKSKTGEGN